MQTPEEKKQVADRLYQLLKEADQFPLGKRSRFKPLSLEAQKVLPEGRRITSGDSSALVGLREQMIARWKLERSRIKNMHKGRVAAKKNGTLHANGHALKRRAPGTSAKMVRKAELEAAKHYTMTEDLTDEVIELVKSRVRARLGAEGK